MQQEIDDGEQYEDFFYGMLHNNEENNNNVSQINQHDIIYDLNNPQKLIEEFYKIEEFPSHQQHYIERKVVYNQSLPSDQLDEDSLKEEEIPSKEQEYKEPIVPNSEVKKPTKMQKKYQELCDIVNRINNVSWSEYTSTSIKQVPLKNMTPMSFWFMICAQYFNKKQFLNSDDLLLEREKQMRIVEVNYRIENQEIDEIPWIDQVEEFEIFYQAIKAHIPDKIPIDSDQRRLTLKLEYDLEDNTFIIAIRQKLLSLWNKIKDQEEIHKLFESKEPMESQVNFYIQEEYFDMNPIDINDNLVNSQNGNQIDIQNENQNDKENLIQNQIKIDVVNYDSDKWAVDLHDEEGKQTQISQATDIDKCEECTYFRWDRLLTFLQRVPLDHITALMTEDLENIIQENELSLKELHSNVSRELGSNQKFQASLDSSDKDEILIDIQGLTQIEKDYMNYLENRQQSGEHLKEIMQQKMNRTNLSGTQLSNRIMGQDLVCQICNDGDYLEDNQIVFCARCNISVHQKCYGIEIIPTEDWICDLCKKFSQSGRFLRCPLCTRRGGAMKPSNILTSSPIFEIINPSYHQYIQSITRPCPNYQEDEDLPLQKDDFENQLYYDFQVVQNALDPENIKEIHVDRVWIHLTCAYWLPECFFSSNSKEKQSQIMGVQNIDKKRFNLTCHVCKMKRSGACVQCSRGKCCIAFHPECARRAQLFMEPRPYPSSYLIYCEKHMPLKLKRVLENKAKGYVEEIHNFCRVLERVEGILFQSADKITSNGGVFSEKKKKIALRAQQLEIDAEIKQENIQLIQSLNNYLSSTIINKITIDLISVGKGFEVTNINIPLSSRSERNVMALNVDDAIWSQFSYQKFSKEQIYKLYKRAIRMEKRTRPMKHKRFLDLFDEGLYVKRQRKSSSNSAIRKFKKIKKLLKKIKKQKSNRPRRELALNKIKIVLPLEIRPNSTESKRHTPMMKNIFPLQDNHPQPHEFDLYCICRQPFRDGEDMMQCELCQEWYHLKCIGFTQSIEQATEISFYCFKCEKSVEKERLRKVKQLYKHYFTDPTFKTLKNKILKQKIPEISQFTDINQFAQTKTHEKKSRLNSKPPASQDIQDDSRHFTRVHQRRNYKTMNTPNDQLNQPKLLKYLPQKKEKETKQLAQSFKIKKFNPRNSSQDNQEKQQSRKIKNYISTRIKNKTVKK